MDDSSVYGVQNSSEKSTPAAFPDKNRLLLIDNS
jgi:hypothetical protein